MRDVDAFEKKFQVGEGTYGSVFVAKDRSSNEIVALKRINTEQEENGFPITALREVKLLKGLKHPNMVLLKEIVCSKGTCHTNKFVSNCCQPSESHPCCDDFVKELYLGFDANDLIIIHWRDIYFTPSSINTPRETA